MIKILFVCHGNICRSPMAEFVFKDLVEKRGIADQFEIASAATSTEEIWNGIGNPIYPPAIEELAEHGISCVGKRAVKLRSEDYKYYDYLIGMDSMNINNMMKIMKADSEGKIYMLLQFTGREGGIKDPWYTGNFKETYKDIFEGCSALLEYFESK
ncbi:MAG: low molecular weight protein-tyrosine-phosphatase [Bacteroidales bacterium]